MGQGFTTNYLVTMGAEFTTKSVEILIDGSVNQKVGLQIWDIAGQDVYTTIRQKYLAYASGILLICDLTRIETINNLSDWLDDVWKVNKTHNIPILIIGNKNDLTEERVISNKLLLQYSIDLKEKFPEITKFEIIETSALTGENIDLGFKKIAKQLYENSMHS